MAGEEKKAHHVAVADPRTVRVLAEQGPGLTMWRLRRIVPAHRPRLLARWVRLCYIAQPAC